MPRGSKKILLGIFEAQPISVLEILAKAPKSFTELLEETTIPRATLHRTLIALVIDKFVKKVGNLYTMTSDGELVLKYFRRLIARSTLKLTEDGLQRVLDQANRTLRAEKSRFSRVEQFESIQEAVESVEVVEMPA